MTPQTLLTRILATIAILLLWQGLGPLWALALLAWLYLDGRQALGLE